MKKKSVILIICAVLITAVSASLFSGCAEKKLALKYALDDSVPFLHGRDISSELSQNPYRGLRNEYYITLNDKTNYKQAVAYPGGDETVQEDMQAKAELYDAYSPRVAQLYVYLCNYNEKAISGNALYQLNRLLGDLRTSNTSVLLRFAYEYNDTAPEGPTTEVMLGHIAQIKQWMKNNDSLVRGTVLAVQAGFVGLWGEWHGSKYQHDSKTVLNAIYDMVPSGMYMQVRTMEIKKIAAAANRRTIGFHDDYVTGQANEWHVAGAKTGSSDYKNFLKQSPLLINDGEMPWGRAGVIVDGIDFIKSMKEHCFTSFSLEHNFIEGGQNYSMAEWRGHIISEDTLKSINCGFNPYWFSDADGNPIQRTVFEYASDYLGYQLVASNLKVQDEPTGETVSGFNTVQSRIEFTLTNFGTAAPLNIDKIEVIFRNPATGEILNAGTFNKQRVQNQWAPAKLKSYGQLKFVITDFKRYEGWDIGIKLFNSKNSAATVRLANAVLYENGVNYISMPLA